MSKLTRVTQSIFGSSASDIGVFGSAQANAGPGTISTNIATIMGLAAWAGGWLDAVIGGSKFPPLEEVNGIEYVITSQLAYLFQQGIPEYDSGTTYYANSMCMQSGTYNIYGSNTNGNQGNALSNATYWTLLGNLANIDGLTVASYTETSRTFAATDTGNYISRQNSGTAMTDTLPGTSGALAAGAYFYVRNGDVGNASLTISPGSGGTLYIGVISYASITLLPGETWLITSDGSGVYFAQRIASAVLHSAPPQGDFKNLKGIWASNTTATYTADAIIVQDSNANTRRITSFSETLNTATSGAGGLDTGSLASSTWYFVWAIFNPTTGTQNILFSLSATAPTLPSGYIFAALIGAFYSDASSHIRGFIQYGRDVQNVVGNNLTGLPQMASGTAGSVTTPTWVAISLGSFVPSIASKIKVLAGNASGAGTLILAPNNSYGAENSSTNPPPTNQNVSGAVCNLIFELGIESSNIYWANNNSASILNCLGFTLNL